jgi:stage V sporulation protein S
MTIVKVSAQSRSGAVAGAIAGIIRDTGCADVQAIGPLAVNQAAKAVAIARGYLTTDNIDVICIPSFQKVEVDGEERTALRLVVEPR